MADRTLVAYVRDGGYELHYAHSGVDPDALGPATPFGGVTERDLAHLRDRLEPLGVDLSDATKTHTAVDPDPMATVDAWDVVVAGLDYRAYEWVLRVGPAWSVERFLVCDFGLGERGGDSRDPQGDGALLSVGRVEEPYARGWFEGMKSTVADGRRRGLCTETQARAYMTERVRAFGDGPTYVAGA